MRSQPGRCDAAATAEAADDAATVATATYIDYSVDASMRVDPNAVIGSCTSASDARLREYIIKQVKENINSLG